MSHVKKAGFDLNKLLDSLKKTINSEGEVLLQYYVETYEELCLFFGSFGTIFGFVVSDVSSKIQILNEHREGEHHEKYMSVQSMTDYEVAEDKTVSKTKLPSGSRTLLRLHRALLFILLLLEQLLSAQSDEYMGSRASQAYHSSLANHHPWFIRKMVAVALHTLSTKDSLMQKLSPLPQEESTQLLKEAITETRPVYDKVQTIYQERDLLNLP